MTILSNSDRKIRRVAILFAGGPAPAANAVISTCAASFVRNGIGVLGIKYGYSSLSEYSPERPLEPGRDYIDIDLMSLRRTRTRKDPDRHRTQQSGKDVSSPSHLGRSRALGASAARVRRVVRFGRDALISIGGDDTLKTANKFKLFQDRLAGRCPPNSLSSTCRRPSTMTTPASILPSAISPP
jgi:6-phosphofructokinase 1